MYAPLDKTPLEATAPHPAAGGPACGTPEAKPRPTWPRPQLRSPPHRPPPRETDLATTQIAVDKANATQKAAAKAAQEANGPPIDCATPLTAPPPIRPRLTKMARTHSQRRTQPMPLNQGAE